MYVTHIQLIQKSIYGGDLEDDTIYKKVILFLLSLFQEKYSQYILELYVSLNVC